MGLALSATLGATLSATLGATRAQAITLDEARTQLEDLGSQLASIQDELATQTNDLEKIKATLDDCQGKIDATTQELGEARDMLARRTRAQYKTGTMGLIDIIVNATSFEDLLTRVYYADAIAEADAQAIQEVKSIETRLEQEREDLKEQEDTQQSKVSALEAKSSDYSAKVDEATAVFNELDAQERARLAAEAEAREKKVNANGTNTDGLSNAIGAAQQNPADQDGATSGDGSEADSPDTSTSSQGSQGQNGEPPRHNSDFSGNDVVSLAMSFVGKVPYVYAGNSPEEGFDCSGMTCYVYRQIHGVELPRTTYGQIELLKRKGAWRTSMDQLRPGDLLFTQEGHVGIYAGNGMLIDAPYPGLNVRFGAPWAFIGGGNPL